MSGGIWRLAAFTLLTVLTATARPGAAHAQSYATEAAMVQGEHPFRSPQRFAFELRFGPYRPDVDSEFGGHRTPYKDYFGDSRKLMTQIELDYEFFHGFGSLGAGVGVGFFTVSGQAPAGDGTGALTGDSSTFKVFPLSLSAVYRFDVLSEKRKIPIVPYGKIGLDYAYWQITNGNGDIASDGTGGTGRGGTTGWHAAGGVALVLDALDPDAARDFDADLGVNHTALVFEYRYANISGLGSANRLHVGDTSWSLGIMLEF